MAGNIRINRTAAKCSTEKKEKTFSRRNKYLNRVEQFGMNIKNRIGVTLFVFAYNKPQRRETVGSNGK